MMLQSLISRLFLMFTLVVPGVNATVIHVDARNGSDRNTGAVGRPLRTLGRAASLVNERTTTGHVTIKIAPGVYPLAECVEFNSPLRFAEDARLVIEASILPDEPMWQPGLMPVILSTEDPRTGDAGQLTGTYSLKIKNSHVTVRGLKFLGNALSNNMHCCVERIGERLDDLIVTQCMFVGNKDTLNIYCAALATGDRFVVDHCIFYQCHGSVVFWDGIEGIAGKGNAMKYCIVDGG